MNDDKALIREQIKEYFSEFSFGEIPDSQNLVTDFEFKRRHDGSTEFNVDVCTDSIAEYGATTFVEWLIDNKLCEIKGYCEEGEDQPKEFEFQVGPLVVKVSRTDIECLLALTASDANEGIFCTGLRQIEFAADENIF